MESKYFHLLKKDGVKIFPSFKKRWSQNILLHFLSFPRFYEVIAFGKRPFYRYNYNEKKIEMVLCQNNKDISTQ